VPNQAFHLVWSGQPLSVANTNKLINGVNAYPNPANGVLNIPFELNEVANVSVTLTSMIGQVVATQNMGNVDNGVAKFNTSALATGMYIYTVNANGEHFTGRIVVTH
jgi:hypothetical protein